MGANDSGLGAVAAAVPGGKATLAYTGSSMNLFWVALVFLGVGLLMTVVVRRKTA
jgi:LPXTG-motif cell wall-anchored protein